MKVFVAGATGRVATELIKHLMEQGHEVVAGVRNPEKIEGTDGVIPVKLDLHQDVNALTEVIKGVDAVYFTAGSRGQDVMNIDAYGAVKLMQASEKAGIKRFILLSWLFADQPELWQDEVYEKLGDYNLAKFFADHWLMSNTKLDYTIVQPGILSEEPASGLIRTDVEQMGSVAIGDVASVLSNVLDKENTQGKIIRFVSGDTDIETAIQEISE